MGTQRGQRVEGRENNFWTFCADRSALKQNIDAYYALRTCTSTSALEFKRCCERRCCSLTLVYSSKGTSVLVEGEIRTPSPKQRHRSLPEARKREGKFSAWPEWSRLRCHSHSLLLRRSSARQARQARQPKRRCSFSRKHVCFSPSARRRKRRSGIPSRLTRFA